ncbi:MAG TPA: hypothetical protein VJU77_03610 [Chthoniobacterales bacterium]|nr:hypothetical protein [Chthoniobacterales bacterium]
MNTFFQTKCGEGLTAMERTAAAESLILPSLDLLRYAAAAFSLFFLGACAAVEQSSNAMYSSLLSNADIAEITALVARRSDIRQPIFRITTQDARSNRFVVYTGHKERIGDQSDYFSVQKLHGTWHIVSTVSHDIVIPHPERAIVT